MPNVTEIWESKPPGTLWATPGLLRDCFAFTYTYIIKWGARCGVVVKALRYKPGGRGFDSRWCNWNFSVT